MHATSTGPLTGIRVLDLSTVYAAPITAMLLGDFGADVHQGRAPARRPGPHPRLEQGRPRPVVEGHRPQQAHGHAQPRQAARARSCCARLVADADVLIENFRPGVMEKWGLGPDALQRDQPRAGDAAGHRVRPDRPLRAAARVRHAGRGDERASPTRPASRTGRRRCRRSGSPTASPASPARYAVLLALYHRDAKRRPGQVIDLVAARAAAGILGPGPSVYDQLGIVAGPARQPLAQQRPAQRLPHPRRPLGGDLGQRHLDRRARDAPGRAGRTSPTSRGSPRPASAADAPRCSTAPSQNGSPRATSTRSSTAFEDAGAAIAPIYDVEQLVNDPHVHGPRHDHHRRRRGPRPAEDAEPDLPAGRAPRAHPLHGGRRLGQDNDAVYAELSASTAEQLAELRERGGHLMDRSYLFAPGHNAKLLTGCSPPAPTR